MRLTNASSFYVIRDKNSGRMLGIGSTGKLAYTSYKLAKTALERELRKEKLKGLSNYELSDFEIKEVAVA